MAWWMRFRAAKPGEVPMIQREVVDPTKFNPDAILPFELRLKDFELSMQDVYDFFFDVNAGLVRRGLERLDDMLRPANMSGLVSDMLSASVANIEAARQLDLSAIAVIDSQDL